MIETTERTYPVLLTEPELHALHIALGRYMRVREAMGESATPVLMSAVGQIAAALEQKDDVRLTPAPMPSPEAVDAALITSRGIAPKAREFTVVNYESTRTDEYASIHAKGCTAIGRTLREHGGFTYDVEGSLQDAIDTWLDEETRDMGYDERHVHVHRCAREAK